MKCVCPLRKHYLNVITYGPLIIVRTPWPTPKWRLLLKAITVVMHTHGFKQKDITAIEGMTQYDPSMNKDNYFWWNDRLAERDVDLVSRLEEAFAGNAAVFPDFWLYDWRDDGFTLVRCGVK